MLTIGKVCSIISLTAEDTAKSSFKKKKKVLDKSERF